MGCRNAAVLAAAVAVASLAGSALADSAVVTLFLPQFDAQPLVASVVDVGPSATTYTIACAGGNYAIECGVGAAGSEGPTVVNGPATWSIHMTQAGIEDTSYIIDGHCDLADGKAACVETVNNEAATTTLSGISTLFLPVTVTAGADKLGAAATPGASPSGDAPPATTGTDSTGGIVIGTATGTLFGSGSGTGTMPGPTASVGTLSPDTGSSVATTSTGSSGTQSAFVTASPGNSTTAGHGSTSGSGSSSARKTTSSPASASSNVAAAQKTQGALLAGVAVFMGGIAML